MTAGSRARPAAVADAAADWDAGVVAAGGRLLQSWRWGEFKARHGWAVERVAVERGGLGARAQMLFKRRGPFAFGYVPRGPLLDADDPDLLDALLTEMDRVCRRQRAISVMLEPERRLPPSTLPGWTNLPSTPTRVQPGRTVRVPLLDDEPLLMQMHQKTRYNIRLAARRGVTIAIEDPARGFDAFHALMRDTAGRNDFAIHDGAYYRDALAAFGEDAALMLARAPDGEPAAALISVAFGAEGVYLYGASSSRHRSLGPGFALQFEAMRWARERGCVAYDLWGIPETDPPTTKTEEGDRVATTHGNDWRGLYEFKIRFGGAVVSYPPPLERPYLPILPALARRFSNRGT